MSVSAFDTERFDDETFSLVRELVREATGVALQDNVRFVVGRRILSRCQTLGLRSYRAYYRLLKHATDGARELDELIELIVVNETYFFRESEQLRALTEVVLPALFAERGASEMARIWSAGCSTGEEPFTIAMLIEESLSQLAPRIDIFASDISRRVLRHARLGRYRPAAMRVTDASRKQHFFSASDSGYELVEKMRKRVTFAHINLIDPAALHLVANMDVIVCRNVLIYFDREARLRIIDMFFRKLRPGGYLLLGHSESLLGREIERDIRFEVSMLAQGIVYRRPLVESLPARKEAP